MLQGIKAGRRQPVPGADQGEGKGKPCWHGCRGLRASPHPGGGLTRNPTKQHPGSHSFTSVYSMDLDATGLEQGQKSTFLFFGSTLT